MSKKIAKTYEVSIRCPLYKKSCKGCPSEESKSYILSEKDLQTLLKLCSTENFESCSIFIANQELAA